MKKPDFGTAGEKVKASFRSRTSRVGGYSIAAGAVVIAIAIIINLLVGRLPSTVTKLDMTANSIFTLSDQTKEIVSGLDRDTTIYWIVSAGKEDDTISKLLDRYLDLSDKLTVQKVDPVVYPSFTAKYTSDKVSDNSLIVVCGDKNDYIAFSDIYQYDYSEYYYNGNYTTSFDGESCITSAIDYVMSDNLPKMYVLNGHGEQSLSSAMQSAVKKQNFETADLSLLTESAVPEDANCVLICGPTSDISADEAAKLKTYVDGGGNLLLLTGYSTSGTELPNLVGLMQNYGVTTDNSLVIEGDSSRCLTGYNYYLLPNEKSHTITDPIISAGYYILAPVATGITHLADTPENVTITDILTTSESAYAKHSVSDGSTLDKSDDDISGPFAVGVAVEYAANDSTTGHIVWYSSSMMLDDDVNQKVSGANEDLLINSLGWMCARQSAVSIHAKSLDSGTLTVPSASSSLMSFVMIGLLPIGFLAAGVYVFVRRKRR